MKPIWVFAGPASKKIIYVPDEVADQPAAEGWGQRLGAGKLQVAKAPGPNKKAEAFLAQYGPAPYRTSELRPQQNPAPEPEPKADTPKPKPEPEPAQEPAAEEEASTDGSEAESEANEEEAPKAKATRKRK